MGLNIHQHLPEPPKTGLIQGQIPIELRRRVNKIRNAAKPSLTWSELMTACLTAFVAEDEKKKKN
jgi:hypothetical protein